MDLMRLRRAVMMSSGALSEVLATGNPIYFTGNISKNFPYLQAAFAPYQFGSGDPSPSNVRPITGTKAVKVIRSGVNIAPTTGYVSGYFINNSGEVTENANYRYQKDYIPVKASTTYTVSMRKTSSTKIGFTVPVYTSNKAFAGRFIPIDSTSSTSTVTGTFTTGSTTAFIRFSVPIPSEDIMIIEGTDTTYVAYNGDTLILNNGINILNTTEENIFRKSRSDVVVTINGPGIVTMTTPNATSWCLFKLFIINSSHVGRTFLFSGTDNQSNDLFILSTEDGETRTSTGTNCYTIKNADVGQVLTARIYRGANATVTFHDLQVEECGNSTTVSQFEQYSPLIFSTPTGKNLFDESTMINGYFTSNVDIITANDAYRVVKLTLPPGTYTFSTSLANPYIIRAWWDGETHNIAGNTFTRTITTTTTGVVAFNFRNSSTSAITETFHTMIEKGSSVTTYEPADFTIYGGYIDFTAGEIVVQYTSVTLNGSESWTEYGSVGGSEGLSFALSISSKKIGFQTSMCNAFKNVNQAWASANKTSVGIYSDHNSNRTMYFRAPNAEITTVAGFKAWLNSNPIQLVYQLNTPYTISTFTPATLNSLIGPNIVWANTNDNVTLKYKAIP